MTRNSWRLLAVALVAASAAVFAPSAEASGRDRATSVSSPDRRIAVKFQVDRQGTPLYRVSRNGAPVLADSALGFQFEDAPALDDDLEVRSVRQRRHDSVWRPVWGEYKAIRNHYNELTIDLRERVAPRRRLQLVFRVFDDGVGFRYVLPRQQAIDSFAITEEDTEFNFADDFTRLVDPGAVRSRQRRRGALPPHAGERDGRRRDAGHRRRGRRRLRDPARGRPHRLRDDERRAGGRLGRCARPWSRSRTASRCGARAATSRPGARCVIGDTPGDLIESTLVLNLNDPCAICRPGHVVDQAGQVRRRVVGDPQGPVGVVHRHRAAARSDDRERQALHRLRRGARHPVRARRGLERGLGDAVHDAGLPHPDARLRPRGGRRLRQEQGRRLDRAQRDRRQRHELREPDRGGVLAV